MSFKLQDIKEGDLIYIENLSGYGDSYPNKNIMVIVTDYTEYKDWDSSLTALVHFIHPITKKSNHVNDYDGTLDVFYKITCPALDIMRGEK